MERPKSSTSIVHGKGWLWLHFNLADRAPVTFWTPARIFPRRRALLVSVDEHQQLHGSDVCLYGIVADRGLDGITEEVGFLHFALTETVFISSRRPQLNAVEATRKVLRRGLKVQTPSALLEVIAGQMIESLDQFADGVAGQLDRAEGRQRRLPVGDGDHRCRLDCRLLAAETLRHRLAVICGCHGEAVA
jgi:zinc transporter